MMVIRENVVQSEIWVSEQMLYNQKICVLFISLITNANAKTNNANPNQKYPIYL